MSKFYDLKTNILLQADDFFEAYKRCIEGKNKRRDEYGRIVYSCVNIPAIVNGSFAVELYLKSLSKEKAIKGHNLKDLFDVIDISIQEKINNECDKDCLMLNWNKNFVGYLEDMSNAFIEWRYIFEEEKSEGFMGDNINKFLQYLQIILPKMSNIAKSYYKEES